MSDLDDFYLDAFKTMLGSALFKGGAAFRELVSPEMLAQVLAPFDFVVAVFPDAEASTGVQFFPVKGWDEWKGVARGEIDRDLRSNAVPCPDRASALALLAQFGNPDWANEALPGALKPRLRLVTSDGERV